MNIGFSESLILTLVGSAWAGFDPQNVCDRISFLRVLLSSLILGLPGVLVGVGLFYCFLGQVKLEVCFLLFALAMFIELPLHAVWAHFWNRRAAALANDPFGVGQERDGASLPRSR